MRILTCPNALLRTMLPCMLAVGVAGCTISDIPILFRPDTEQGALFEEESVAKLEPGMSREQVRFLMGTPPVDDPFRKDRWDYVYRRKSGWGEETEMRRLTLFFEQDELVGGEGNVLAENHPLNGAH